MPDAVVSSKGQITIPAEIRRQMKLEPQDKVVFTNQSFHHDQVVER